MLNASPWLLCASHSRSDNRLFPLHWTYIMNYIEEQVKLIEIITLAYKLRAALRPNARLKGEDKNY